MNYAQPDPQEHQEEVSQMKIAIVSAGLSHMGNRETQHSQLVRQQVAGARKSLTDLGVPDEHIIDIECPGVLEIPQLVEAVISKHKVDGVVAAALIVDGGVYRHEFVAQTSLDKLMQIPLDTGVPVASSLLTPVQSKSPETQFDFLKSHLFNKGEEAASALLRQILQLRAL